MLERENARERARGREREREREETERATCTEDLGSQAIHLS